MYTINLSFGSIQEWVIKQVISHHNIVLSWRSKRLQQPRDTFSRCFPNNWQYIHTKNKRKPRNNVHTFNHQTCSRMKNICVCDQLYVYTYLYFNYTANFFFRSMQERLITQVTSHHNIVLTLHHLRLHQEQDTFSRSFPNNWKCICTNQNRNQSSKLKLSMAIEQVFRSRHTRP